MNLNLHASSFAFLKVEHFGDFGGSCFEVVGAHTLAVIGAYLLCSQHHTDADGEGDGDKATGADDEGDDGDDGDGDGYGGNGVNACLNRYCSTAAKHVYVHPPFLSSSFL